ncbi:MAG: PhoD-like phosphatase [Cyanobacteria bacterium J06598_3]
MKYLAGDDLLEGLPLILAGPILRRTQADAVTVWVAVKHHAQVTLRILETHDCGAQLGECLFQSQRETIALGQHLHVVALTARARDGNVLKSDRIYAYDLDFTADKSYTLAEGLRKATGPESSRFESSRFESSRFESISYFAHQKPTFSLPPTDLSQLKIVHGSCRKPHGRGFDALPILDCLLEADAHSPQDRPHQLFMTGDQIYGDDVADPLLWLATPLGDALLGWKEKLPLDPLGPNGTSEVPYQARPKQLIAGKRAQVATQQAGLTAGLRNKSERTTSHLFSFGEYSAAYLLAYSPACWPDRLPAGQAVTTGRKTIRRWNKDKRNMTQFLHSLWKVRRLLANIPTYTIFDDHDVSDDWNLNQEWCLKTLGKPLGQRTVQNALLAYAAFQAWGNTPAQFETGTVGALLLSAAEQWSRSGGEDQTVKAAIAVYLGLPPTHPNTGLPEFVEDQDVWVLQRSPKALTWHYTIHSACHEVIVLDTRTWRGYPIDGRPIDPPMLLSPTAFKQQLSEPLSQRPQNGSNQQSDRQADRQAANTPFATFVVAPTNVFGMRALDWIQQWHLDQRKVFSADVGDSWNFHDPALATLLLTLFEYRQNVVVLSGDIHYSSAIYAEYQNFRSGNRATLVQLTSSAMKNEELLTQILHTRLKDWLLPERSRQWVGQLSPPNMEEVSVRPKTARPKTEPASQKPSGSHLPNGQAPDWSCKMSWLRRQRAQTVDLVSPPSELIPPRTRPQAPLVKWLKFWKARWLQEGREVVGVNNIALVHFSVQNTGTQNTGTQDTDTQNTGTQNTAAKQKESVAQSTAFLSIQQKHYWFSPWSPTQVVCSQFKPLDRWPSP